MAKAALALHERGHVMQKSGVAALGAAIGAGVGYVVSRAMDFGEPAFIAALGALVGSVAGYWIAKRRNASVESTERVNARHP